MLARLILSILLSVQLNTLYAQKAYALLVGLKTINHEGYKPRKYSDGATLGAHADVKMMSEILSENGFPKAEISTLYDAQATRDSVLSNLNRIVEGLQDEDIFVFYYSGHGDNIPDVSRDEEDKLDEALVCYDQYLLDDDLYKVWLSSNKKKRIVMIIDACKAGSTYKIFGDHEASSTANPWKKNYDNEVSFQANFLKQSNLQTNKNNKESFQMIYAGASTDASNAQGGNPTGSKFTKSFYNLFIRFLRDGKWQGMTFREFIEIVSDEISTTQIVSYVEISCSQKFASPYPFKIK